MKKVGTVNKLGMQSACCDMSELFAEFPPFSPTTVHDVRAINRCSLGSLSSGPIVAISII